jgi:hypothetical protein
LRTLGAAGSSVDVAVEASGTYGNVLRHQLETPGPQPVRRGHSKKVVETPLAAPEPVRRPACMAIMLALAHKIQNAIDRGGVQDRAEAARKLGLTRARVTQLRGGHGVAPEERLELPTRRLTAACSAD